MYIFFVVLNTHDEYNTFIQTFIIFLLIHTNTLKRVRSLSELITIILQYYLGLSIDSFCKNLPKVYLPNKVP